MSPLFRVDRPRDDKRDSGTEPWTLASPHAPAYHILILTASTVLVSLLLSFLFLSFSMASSSKTMLAPPRTMRPQSDTFRPRLPTDPFSMSSKALRDPWFLKYDSLLSTTAAPTCRVVLVVGGMSWKA